MENIISYNIINKFLDNDFLDNLENERKINIQKNNLEIFPINNKIFRCFEYFNLLNTKILILGQDPYHGKNQATGLAFGIDNASVKQPSLKNIEKELYNDLNIKLKDQTLEKWAKQNVLLLNSSLTVIQGKPGSHIKLWNNFTNMIIDYINNNCDKVIFVAWGAYSYNKLKHININKHELIVSSHPSPLSCYKNYKEFPPFLNSKPFSKINQILEKNNKTKINW